MVCAALSGQLVQADDALKAAQRLLRVADVQRHYEDRTAQQVRAIIRTYSSIVSMSAEVDLPLELTQRINSCYTEVYAWENFESGLAQILADNLTARELQLLADFYGNLGLPPFEIQRFRDTIAKSDIIEKDSLEFMWANSASCVEHDAALIRAYLATRAPVAEIASD